MEYFKSKREEFLQFLKEVVEIETPSGEKDAVNKLTEYLEKKFNQLGVQTKILDGMPDGNHLLLNYGEGQENIMILGHMDTVWKVGTLKEMPFKVEHDKVSGPGVFDMKAGIVFLWFVLDAFKQLGQKPKKKIIALFTSDEESGSETSKKYILEYAKDCNMVLVLEPAGEEGALKTFRKGLGTVKVDIKGRSAHAGLNHQNSISAVKELAYLTLEAEKLTNYSQGTTINVGVVQGGTSSNVVPAEAFAEIDFRFTKPEEGERVEKFFKEYSSHVEGTEITVNFNIERLPLMRTPEVIALFDKAKNCAFELDFELKEISVGGVSDGNFTSAIGIPTLDGLGPVGGGAHATNEYINITESLKHMALLYKLLLDL